ncbi:glycoside hydrolase family 76 protein [Hypoxylon rubiginosum]|uniref:Glycoside hydrolase family 76 protein n=1 Tax=Hypoxylon rubiginosum TaxID=110542 RepID=A0ACB9YJC3_9PEZI|nr:glycoside hydrolase family 76 protein [Hypoxylon rubiginosum]
MSYYDGNEPGNIPGILPEASSDKGFYYWWTGGLLWGSMLDYRSQTGETKYDDLISQGLIWQVGENADYLPANFTSTLGNDDQTIWALSALDADESAFTAPPSDAPQWLTLAENVFNEQAGDGRRVDDGDCKGALRWMLYPFNNGYDYVNSGSNIGFFNLAAQLVYVTRNETYSDAASDTYDLLVDIGFITDKYQVYDGAHAEDCSSINKAQFSYTAAMLLQGSAYLYNHTDGDDKWKGRVDGLVDAILATFFPDGVAFEASCEKSNLCNTDMMFYKGILNRGLGATMQVAPYTAAKILPVLKTSAKAAVAQCTGGDSGRLCGFHWSTSENDGTSGAAQQLGVLSALVSILPQQAVAAAASNSSSGSGAGSSANGGSGSQNGTDSNTSDSNTPGSLGAKVSTSLGALVGALVLGSLFLA